MNQKLVAIVDDEPDINKLISLHLKKNGFLTKEFYDGQSLLNYLLHHQPDLIILDLLLPDCDGIEICKYLRHEERYSQVPIIILTAKSEEMDKIIGLELGADDYVSKPFSPRELVARVKAVLRRYALQGRNTISIKGILTIDPATFEVYVNDKRIELTTTEFRILLLLAEKAGWVFSREKILDHLWRDKKAVLDRTIDVHIKHLRVKLGPAGKYIKNIRGIGYKLDSNVQE